jgi:hypothetical protein
MATAETEKTYSYQLRVRSLDPSQEASGCLFIALACQLAPFVENSHSKRVGAPFPVPVTLTRSPLTMAQTPLASESVTKKSLGRLTTDHWWN